MLVVTETERDTSVSPSNSDPWLLLSVFVSSVVSGVVSGTVSSSSPLSPEPKQSSSSEHGSRYLGVSNVKTVKTVMVTSMLFFITW